MSWFTRWMRRAGDEPARETPLNFLEGLRDRVSPRPPAAPPPPPPAPRAAVGPLMVDSPAEPRPQARLHGDDDTPGYAWPHPPKGS